jgi:hypothetical protein
LILPQPRIVKILRYWDLEPAFILKIALSAMEKMDRVEWAPPWQKIGLQSAPISG